MEIGRGGADIEYEGIASRGSGSTASAYLAVPASNAGAGLVVIHDEWGLTDFVRDVCDRLARSGFVALAPDLFDGYTAENPAAAEQMAKDFDLDAADASLESAVAELFNQQATLGAKVGALGIGLGGSLAVFLSTRHRRIGAVADVDGTHTELLPELDTVSVPVLAILAGDGEFATDGAVSAFESGLQNVSIELKRGVRNGYMDEARLDVHDATAAAESWDALLAFFRSELG